MAFLKKIQKERRTDVMDFGIGKGTRDDAKRDFSKIFGTDFMWLWDIFEAVKKIEVEKDIKITDILIKKGSPPLVGILKNFFLITDFLEDAGFEVPGTAIKSFVEKYISYYYGDKKKGAERSILSLSDGSINFSLNIYTLGSYRINYSESVSGPMLNIRVLDFNIPDLEELLTGERGRSDLDNIYLEYFKKHLLRSKVFEVLDGGDGENENKNEKRGEKGEEQRRSVVLNVVNDGGLIIHAGPTGSGKTTTIAAEIDFFANNISGLVITYEKPIEYRFLGYPNVIQYDLEKHLDESEIYNHF